MNRLENDPKVEEGEQILEGRINDVLKFREGDWKKILPNNYVVGDVEEFLKSEEGQNVYYWHLKPGLIKDERQRKRWEEERNTYDVTS